MEADVIGGGDGEVVSKRKLEVADENAGERGWKARQGNGAAQSASRDLSLVGISWNLGTRLFVCMRGALFILY